MDKVKTYAVLACGVVGAMWGKLGALAPLILALLMVPTIPRTRGGDPLISIIKRK